MKQYGYSWDEWEDGKTNEALFEEILTDNAQEPLKEIVISNWEGGFEGDSPQPVIDWFIQQKEKFSQLTRLRIGNMEQEECELSWIIQGDYSAFWAAFPRLRTLTLQGSDSLTLGEIHSDSLQELTVICGGLPRSVLEAVTHAKAPNLVKLNLYLGVEDYGFDATIDDIVTLLAESDFPKLRYLGLCNSELADDIAQSILTSQYAGQIETLDLSKSVFTDKGAQKIIDHAAALKNLKVLDLTYHYVTPAFMEKLRALPFEVLLDDAQEYNEDDHWYNQPMFTE